MDSTMDEIVNRFEVPFDLQCRRCQSVAAKGIRVNAMRKPVGSYYTRKIWSYTIECAYCGQKIVMERVSQDSKYKVIKGAMKKKAKQEIEGASGQENFHTGPVSRFVRRGLWKDPRVLDSFHILVTGPSSEKDGQVFKTEF